MFFEIKDVTLSKLLSKHVYLNPCGVGGCVLIRL